MAEKKKPAKKKCEYRYCQNFVETRKKFRDKEDRDYCIFHTHNEEKAEEFYKQVNKIIDEKNNSTKKALKELVKQKLPEEYNQELVERIRSENRIVFEGFYFPQTADFRAKIFLPDINFYKAKFNDKADFSLATFRGEAYFSSTDFSGEVDFTRATFSEKVYFSNATFGESEKANFSKATFSGETFFLSASFNGKVDFSRAIFSGETNFCVEHIKSDLSFEDVKFLKRAIFTNTDLSNVTFDGAELHNSLLQGIKYSNKTMKGILLDTFTENSNRTFAREAADFNYLEQRKLELKKLKESVKTRKQRRKYFWRNGLFELWKHSSDYGNNFWKWLLGCFFIAIYFGIIYAFLMSHNMILIHEKTDHDLFALFYYSIVTFTTLGFGDIIPVNWLARIYVTLEVIAGYLMLGALIIILANKFARRA